MFNKLRERIQNWVLKLNILFRQEALISRKRAESEILLRQAKEILEGIDPTTSDKVEQRAVLARRIERLEQSTADLLATVEVGKMSRFPALIRILAAFMVDPFLAFATVVYLIFSIASIILFAPELWIFLKWAVGQAFRQAQAADNNAPPPFNRKDVIFFGIFFVISTAFFCAFGMLAFSNKSDARKFAADTIKMILGVYLGMATKLLD